MHYTILDCYTDEPAGLGVPPYIGTYPRYIAGKLISEGHLPDYLTVDDLRLFSGKTSSNRHKTDIRTYNLTGKDTASILAKTDALIVICGVHVPGKYLSAMPATMHEVSGLVKGLRCRKLLAGPAATVFGTRLEGGKKAERPVQGIFDGTLDSVFSYDDTSGFSVKGAVIVKQIPYLLIAEIETARGCSKKVPCSFCTEPLKNRLEFRKTEDIISEVRALRQHGIRHFRLGKQSDLFSRDTKSLKQLLSGIRNIRGIKTLHIDNIDPAHVTEEKVKIVVKYCTEGNVAALGIETFDKDVIRVNRLNSSPEMSMRAIRVINKYGSGRGPNGMPRFLPGINILFGLRDESKKTHEANMRYLKQILDQGLLVRRINVRQVAVFPGTALYNDCGDRFIKKNKRYYWKWRNDIRQNIDNPMLKKILPVGSVLKGVRMEIYDGNTTFGRQLGTYPLVVGVKERLGIGKSYDVEVVGHMLRSITAKVL